jgi:hypothetical protein
MEELGFDLDLLKYDIGLYRLYHGWGAVLVDDGQEVCDGFDCDGLDVKLEIKDDRSPPLRVRRDLRDIS